MDGRAVGAAGGGFRFRAQPDGQSPLAMELPHVSHGVTQLRVCLSF
jgi:hypothetical protein